MVPAAGVIQKLWRGMKGRQRAAEQRLRRASAIEIQVTSTTVEKETLGIHAEHSL